MANLLVIVSYKVFPPQMGGQKGIVHFYEHLKQHHSIFMVVSSDNSLVDLGYYVENFLFNNLRIGRNMLHLRRLKNIIKKEKIEAIIAEHSYTGWIGWLLKTWTGIPLIIHSHNIEASRFRQMGKKGWKWYQRYEAWIHKRADFSFFKTEEEKNFAIRVYALQEDKCGTIPYGVNSVRMIPDAAQKIKVQYQITNEHLFYFNGTLDYAPNREAVERIIDTIHPFLQARSLDFTILISGKNLSPQLLQKIETVKNIVYLHYVDDVNLLYQASTLFLNPVINDSGVKTKLVEALTNNCTVISAKSGATGIPKDVCGPKLIITRDGDWPAFVAAMLENLSPKTNDISTGFLAYFSWPNIAKKAAHQIQAVINHAGRTI
jgi:glycosyltransferase involved in cell wall biosynthesis